MTLQNLFVSVVHRQTVALGQLQQRSDTGTRLKEEKEKKPPHPNFCNCAVPVTVLSGCGLGPWPRPLARWTPALGHLHPPAAAETRLPVSHAAAPCFNPQLSLLFQ